jgi:hypothetical protein
LLMIDDFQPGNPEDRHGKVYPEAEVFVYCPNRSCGAGQHVRRTPSLDT